MLRIKSDTIDGRDCWEPFLRGNLKEMATTGDGTCSIHSLVCEIDSFERLTHPNPRGWINNIIVGAGRFSDVATLCAAVGQEQLWTNVISSIGNELLLPWLRGDESNESVCFIDCL